MEKAFVRQINKYTSAKQRDTIARLRSELRQDKDIYELSKHNEESLDACLRAMRGLPGTLYIAADMRVFGDTQDAIAETVGKCELAKVRVVDLAHPELVSMAMQQRFANRMLAGDARWGKGKKRAKRTGAQGGKAKALVAAAKRAERVPDETIERLLAVVYGRKVLTWRLLEWALGGKPFSTGTLRRHYDAAVLPPPKSRKAREE